MHERLIVVCHLWPGITPMNVWDLTWRQWLLFKAAADAYTARMKEADRG